MSEPPIATNFHEPLDIEVHFATKVTFHGEMTIDVVTDSSDVFLSQIPHPVLGFDTDGVGNLGSTGSSDPVDIRERNLHLLIVRYVNASDTRQSCLLLALTLLVPRVLANHAHHAIAPNDLAFVTAPLYGSTYFHDPT